MKEERGKRRKREWGESRREVKGEKKGEGKRWGKRELGMKGKGGY